MGLLRRQIQQCANCPRSALTRAQFEDLAEQHQRSNNGRSLEINRDAAVHVAEGRREHLREDRRDYAVEIRRARSQADQREHVRRAIHE